MLEQLIPLAAGAGGGLVGGNLLGSLFKTGRGSNSIVGMVAGAIATYFFGDTFGPMIGGLVASGMLEQIIGGLATGAGGGGLATIVWGIIRSVLMR